MTFCGERDMALCGLACVLCSSEDCPGCKARGCKEVSDCSVYQCAIGKGLDGCYQCEDFPCDEGMLQGIRNRAFNRYLRQYGKQALLSRLEANDRNGIVYHKPGGLKGDYDLLDTEEDIIRLIHFGVHDPYKNCPEVEAERFTLRLVKMEDAEDLYRCYSDLRTKAIFTADKYIRDFRYQTLDDMNRCIRFWLDEYRNRVYIRFSICDKATGLVVGTVEMFNALGILRLDLAAQYEKQCYLVELLPVCMSSFYALFDVGQIVTLSIPAAKERTATLQALSFAPYEWPNAERDHYWIHRRT